MKKIESFEQLRELPPGSIVCVERTDKQDRGFAILCRKPSEVHNHGCLKISDSAYDGEDPKAHAHVLTGHDTCVTGFIHARTFADWNIAVLEESELLDLWHALVGCWHAPFDHCSSPVVKEFLLSATVGKATV